MCTHLHPNSIINCAGKKRMPKKILCYFLCFFHSVFLSMSTVSVDGVVANFLLTSWFCFRCAVLLLFDFLPRTHFEDEYFVLFFVLVFLAVLNESNKSIDMRVRNALFQCLCTAAVKHTYAMHARIQLCRCTHHTHFVHSLTQSCASRCDFSYFSLFSQLNVLQKVDSCVFNAF